MKIFLKLLLVSHLIFITHCSYNRNTGNNADGDGDVIYLDRHNVMCRDGEALTGFQIQRPYAGGIRIDYDCFKSDSILADTYNDETAWTDAANDRFSENISGDRLMHIPIKCRENYGLKGFRLESKCGSPVCKIRFNYVCVALKTVNCTTGRQGFFDAVDGQTWTLSKLRIELPDYNVINQWDLDVNYYFRFAQRDGRQFRINYTYCILRNTEAEALAYIANKPANTNLSNNLRILEEK